MGYQQIYNFLKDTFLNTEIVTIISTTLKTSLCSIFITTVITFPISFAISCKNFYGKKIILQMIHTLMGTPPVITGLVVVMLFSRSGPFGGFRLLFTIKAMIIAQILLLIPIIIGLIIPIYEKYLTEIKETVMGMGFSNIRCYLLCLYEGKNSFLAVILSGFGRAVSEVGAVQLSGGNIQYRTRVMTTSIMLETNKGNYHNAIILGIILFFIVLFINLSATILLKKVS